MDGLVTSMNARNRLAPGRYDQNGNPLPWGPQDGPPSGNDLLNQGPPLANNLYTNDPRQYDATQYGAPGSLAASQGGYGSNTQSGAAAAAAAASAAPGSAYSTNSIPAGMPAGLAPSTGMFGGAAFPNVASFTQANDINPTAGRAAFGIGTAALGPVGMALGAANMIGNGINTVSNDDTISNKYSTGYGSVGLSGMQIAGGFLGGNNYNGTPDVALSTFEASPAGQAQIADAAGPPGRGDYGLGSENSSGSSGSDNAGFYSIGGLVTKAVTGLSAKGLRHASGLVMGTTPGNDDKISAEVPENSYVFPATVVSAIGGGNTMAGAAYLDAWWQHHAAAMPDLKMPAYAVKLSAGEYVIHANHVAAIGGGDIAKGHKVLDAMAKNARAKAEKQEP